MKRTFSVLLAVLAVSPLATAATPPSQTVASPDKTMAGFSFQRAFAASEQGKNGLATLTAFQQNKQREVDQRNRQLRDLEQSFQRSLATLAPTVREERFKEIDRFRVDTQRFIEDAQNEFFGVQRDVEGAFLVTLRPIIEQVIKDRGIHILVNLDDKDRVLAADPAIDITAEVIAQLANAKP